MTNSFPHIKNYIDAKKVADQNLAEKIKMQKEARNHISQVKRDLSKTYSQMVCELLTELKLLCYPWAEVYDWYFTEPPTWWIGTLEGEHKNMIPRVEVSLEFDENFTKATQFKCWRVGGYDKTTFWGGKKYVEFGTVYCGLSREELLATLTKLHPPESLQ